MPTTTRQIFPALSLALALLLGAAAANAQEQRVDVQGDVKDETGAVIVGAAVSLVGESGPPRSTVTNDRGQFQVSAGGGVYTLTVTAEGFATQTQRLDLRNGAKPARLSIILYPGIKESVTVNREGAAASLDAEHATGTEVLTETDLQSLPDDPDEFNNRLQQLAVSGGGAPGDAIVTVDGFTAEGMLPPKSSIREVRINPNLFSAEYSQPPFQGGRVEIYTKPGAAAFHGTGFFAFNNAELNARDVFAPRRAPVQTKRYGLQLGGPIVKRRAGYLLAFEARNIEDSATVNAVVLDANFLPSSLSASVRTPKRLHIGSARFDLQLNPKNSMAVSYNLNSNRLGNEGVGGFELAERAFDLDTSQQSLRFTDTAIIGRTMLNEARFGLTRIRLTQTPASHAPSINVLGAFISGGAPGQDVARDEWLAEIADNFTLAAGAHSLKFGTLNFYRHVRDVRADDHNGSFFFGGGTAPELDKSGRVVVGPDGPVTVNISGLEQYRRTLLSLPGGTPTRFSITTGEPSVEVGQWLFSVYAQDEWRLRRNLSLSFGLRYEAQTNPSDKFSLAPRMGVAFTPDKKQQWVLRARAGFFYERFITHLPIEVSRTDEQLIIDSPSFPDPLGSGTQAAAIPIVKQFDRNLRPPTSLLLRVEAERSFPRGWKVQMSHTWTRSSAVLRSRNINAPVVEEGVDPALAPRPFGTLENILQYESSGRIRGRVLFVGLNQPTNKYVNLFFGYLNFHFNSDSDNPDMLPQSSYDLRGEWARPSWQSRHQAFIVSTIFLPRKLRASLSLDSASGTPFNIVTGRDNNGDGNFNDRPNVVDASTPGALVTPFGAFDPTAVNGNLPRNAGTNSPIIRFDLALSRAFVVGRKSAASESQLKLTLNVQARNLFNRVNLFDTNGVLASPFFGRANTAAPARRIELGVRFSF